MGIELLKENTDWLLKPAFSQTNEEKVLNPEVYLILAEMCNSAHSGLHK